MQVQAASGAKDLNPQQVEKNHLIASLLSNLYRLWGYEQISPPNIERLETLTADGGISSNEILKISSDEPLGLRPEITTSIVRAACTRFLNKKRPLRFWSLETVFKCRQSIDGGIDIEENLHSGVELIGISDIKAEIELLSLLIESFKSIKISSNVSTTLLIGHTSLFKLILDSFPINQRQKIKKILSNFNLIELEKLDIDNKSKSLLRNIVFTRGQPKDIIKIIKQYFSSNEQLDQLEELFRIICPLTSNQYIKIQLDPTFESHYELYSGFIFQLIVDKHGVPVVIAQGGRYDKLVKKFSPVEENNHGVGFSFSVDRIREIKEFTKFEHRDKQRVLLAYADHSKFERAILKQRYWHEKNIVSLIASNPCKDKNEAYKLLLDYDCTVLDWLDS